MFFFASLAIFVRENDGASASGTSCFEVYLKSVGALEITSSILMQLMYIMYIYIGYNWTIYNVSYIYIWIYYVYIYKHNVIFAIYDIFDILNIHIIKMLYII